MLLAKENGVPTSQCRFVQLLAAIIGSLIVSKRNHFTLVADRRSVHTGEAHIHFIRVIYSSE